MSTAQPPNNEKPWRFTPADDAETVAQLAKLLHIHPLVVRVLYNRGYKTKEAISRFVRPSLADIYDPFLMQGMKRAVMIILRALEQGWKIIIHGDYDVDGISSVSLLYGYLRDFGANVSYFVPKRDQDGYGVSMETVERFHKEGFELMITTDCGISNAEEIAYAKELGMRVVIVDHHKIPPTIPAAHAVINPLLSYCDYPFKPLAAVGVTFLLAAAIRAELRCRGIFKTIPEPDLRRYLDLVALGTVADVMPLNDLNRILVHHGLQRLASRHRPGIAALMERVKIAEGPITTNDISFRLAPRINAAGRVADASICVELLTTNSFAEAVRLTNELEELNLQRQDEERKTLDEAVEQAVIQRDRGDRILILANKSWHQGVLGIVASRMVDTFDLPAILLTLDDEGVAKGSARAMVGQDLVELFDAAKNHLLTYGGHKLAAGLSVREEEIPALHDTLNRRLAELEAESRAAEPTLDIVQEIGLCDLTQSLMDDIAKLAPFGAGNPEPILATQGIYATSASVVGRNHIRFRICNYGTTLSAFGFSLGHYVDLVNSRPISIAYSPRIVKRRGLDRLELFIRGIKDAREPFVSSDPLLNSSPA